MGARRYGIISDVHANYPALERALAYLDKAGVDKILNLGDMVGYGDDTGAVVAKVQARTDVVSIQGNHERMLLGGVERADGTIGPSAFHHKIWAEKQLSDAQLDFLRGLPAQRVVDESLLMMHSSLVEEDGYILSAEQVRLNLQVLGRDHPQQRVCFFGHTHMPMAVSRANVYTGPMLRTTPVVRLNRENLYLINPGSVGQPRDRSGLSAFGIFDSGAWTMEFIALPMGGNGG